MYSIILLKKVPLTDLFLQKNKDLSEKREKTIVSERSHKILHLSTVMNRIFLRKKRGTGHMQVVIMLIYITNLFEKKRARAGTPLAISRLSIVSMN